MYGGFTYGGTNYGGTGSAGNFYTVTLTDGVIANDSLTKNVSLHKTYTDTINTISTVLAAGMFRRTVSDAFIVIDNGISRITNKVLSETYRVSSVIRRYLNGLLINPWTKVVKTVAAFLKIVKPTATYTKTTKPSNTGIWTKVDKPY